MNLNKLFLIFAFGIAGAYIASIIYCTLGELLEFKHPKEKTVTKAFTKIAGVYFLVSLIYAIGHIQSIMEAVKCTM